MSEKVTTPLRYIGSKRELTSWILEQIPSHENYVEPFGGSAAVLLSKPRSWKETVITGTSTWSRSALNSRATPAGTADTRGWIGP